MKTTHEVTTHLKTWLKSTAATQRDWGHSEAVTILERVSAKLDELLDGAREPLVNLTEAAEISRYSERHLQRLAKNGQLPNHGRKCSPRFRPSELPRKPHDPLTIPARPHSMSEIVRSVVDT